MRDFWVQPENKAALTAALEANLHDILLPDAESHAAFARLARFTPVVLAPDGTFPRGLHARVAAPADVDALIRSAGAHPTVIIDPVDWRAIPAENLIAAFQPTRSRLFAVVPTADDARAMFAMLQVGVDGCVLRTRDPAEVRAFARLRRDLEHHPDALAFAPASVVAVRPVGVGERVCIDTCSLLAPQDGLLVGSSSQALFHVLSEAADLSYVPARPFRVNAGPVHAYCLVPGGKTRYLSELSAGDQVLVVRAGDDAHCRTAVVGRAKIETRPLLLIDAHLEDGRPCSVFVQNAETVRLAVFDPDGHVAMKSVTQLDVGDLLAVKTDDKARHIGMPIDEHLIEK